VDGSLSPVRLGLVAAAALCLLALGSWPYGFYLFLRWVVCAACVAGAVSLSDRRAPFTLLVLIGMALLYNPLVRVHATREFWQVANVGAAVAMGWAAFRLGRVPGRVVG
jgi:hypothetical protein